MKGYLISFVEPSKERPKSAKLKEMVQIRENIFRVTLQDLSGGDVKNVPQDRGYFMVDGLGEVLIDQADLRYIHEMEALDLEPVFHVSRSAALNGAFVVVSRQQKA